MKKESGILLHVSSLPNKYGIGSFGKESYDFIDFLNRSKQKYWQILPLNQTGYGDSPYQSCASNSLNPYFIGLEQLKEEGLLTEKELKLNENHSPYVDYGWLYETRYPLLRKAFERFDLSDKEFGKFVKKGDYAEYALYMAIKERQGNKAFHEWEEGYKKRDEKTLKLFKKQNEKELLFWQFIQFEANKQWASVKKYAHSKGISIIGDIPLYVAYDSVDVWVNPKLFKLDENLIPKKVAGVPPDYFSRTGQLWGNPVYDYAEHMKDGFSWWKNRLKDTFKNFDVVRIDHFRGLDRFYEIDFGMPDAVIGEWQNVPSDELFEALKGVLKGKGVIAEDLGIIDDGVRALIQKTGYPGMRILSFAFDGNKDNTYLPEKIDFNSVCYTGTHDNDTLIGLINGMDEAVYDTFTKSVSSSLEYFKVKKSTESKTDIAKAVIELGYLSNSRLFILPLQDAAFLNEEYRMNIPGTSNGQNWGVRLPKKCFGEQVVKRLLTWTEKYR